MLQDNKGGIGMGGAADGAAEPDQQRIARGAQHVDMASLERVDRGEVGGGIVADNNPAEEQTGTEVRSERGEDYQKEWTEVSHETYSISSDSTRCRVANSSSANSP